MRVYFEIKQKQIKKILERDKRSWYQVVRILFVSTILIDLCSWEIVLVCTWGFLGKKGARIMTVELITFTTEEKNLNSAAVLARGVLSSVF